MAAVESGNEAVESTTVVIAGGGPAGMMAGLLLARAGLTVTVLEKHADFLRDFRGDTVHASTVALLDELGLGAEFRELPQSRLTGVLLPSADSQRVPFDIFSALPAPYNYVAMVPQWDLLNLLAEAANREPTFTLRMRTEATGLVVSNDRVTGVRYRGPDGAGEIHADLTLACDGRASALACDGRASALRRDSGLPAKEYRVPFDVWWFRLPRHPDEAGDLAGIAPAFSRGEALLALTREDYYQLAYPILKGSDARRRAEGVKAFRARVAALRPDLADRVEAIASLDDVFVLDVRLDRLRRWYTATGGDPADDAANVACRHQHAAIGANRGAPAVGTATPGVARAALDGAHTRAPDRYRPPPRACARLRPTLVDHPALGEVLDQRRRACREVFGHHDASEVFVVLIECRQQLAMVLGRLIGPARDRGKHGFGRVAGDLRHQLGELGRVGGDVDRLVELVVQPHRPFVVIAGVRVFELGLDLLDFPELIVGDVGRRPRGELATDVGLHIGHIGEVPPGDRHHHEPAPRLLRKQAFGAEDEQRFAYRCDADTEFDRQLVEANVLPRGVGAIEDPLANEACDILGQLRAGGEIGCAHSHIR
jgi:2-polyprenyl-6-methoxyphenol hydroxylase-like FAD-dependent oxidoreductase